VAPPTKVDYERIEPAWRAGLKSPDQLAAEYTAETGVKVTRQAIQKHFAKRGIPRDQTALVRAKADAMVLEAGVTGKLQSKSLPPATAVVVEQAALDSAAVQLAHRSAVRTAREVVSSLLREVCDLTNEPALADHIAALVAQADAADGTPEAIEKRRAEVKSTLQRVLAMSNRVGAVARLTEALRNLIPLERQAYKMDEGGTGDGTYEERLRQLYEGGTA
jgi:hypothetical protein